MKSKILHSLALIATCTLVLGIAKIAVCQSSNQYRTLPQSIRKPPNGKIEVIEFFTYSSPFFRALDPTVDSFFKKLPKDVIFRRFAVFFSEPQSPHVQLFFTLETMGLLDKLHSQIILTLNKNPHMLRDQKQIADWMSEQGVDRGKFLEVYNSFGVKTKIHEVMELFNKSQSNAVPAFLINGQFITWPMPTERDPHADQLFNVLNQLITKARTTGSVGASQRPTSIASLLCTKSPKYHRRSRWMLHIQPTKSWCLLPGIPPTKSVDCSYIA